MRACSRPLLSSPPLFSSTVNISLPPETIGVIDSAYLGLLWLYGQGPRTLRSLLFTGAVYGLPTLLHLLHYDQAAGIVDHLPKYATRVSTAYSAISLLALALAAIVAIPVLSALFKMPAVQEMVHEAQGALAAGAQGGGGGAAGQTRTKGSAPLQDGDEDEEPTGPRSRHGYKLEQ